jgi:transcriptional regulator with XRE-family HTH domain
MTRDQLKIIRLLKKLDISQAELAEVLGVTRGAVCHWVNGVTNPSKTVMKLIEEKYK